MDLWIRSQDKDTLMQVTRVDYSDGHIVAYQPNDDCEILIGTYESKERSLEVLDEIQQFRDALIGFELLPQKERKTIIQDFFKNKESLTYKMPKE